MLDVCDETLCGKTEKVIKALTTLAISLAEILT